jgi:1,4-dihydroxy-6-naphthoate synthase
LKIRLAISPCPNDTFAFHGLLEGQVDRRGLDFDVRLLDIQELNEGLERGDFDVAKASFAAALDLARQWAVLPVGAAVGFGVGPLLLAGPDPAPPLHQATVLCPGAGTTATLLLRCLHPEIRACRHRNFAEIMPILARGEAGYGVVIHEGRFTYETYGLRMVEDLGQSWESLTGCPVPLGGILGRLGLGEETLHRITAVIRDSLDLALAHPEQPLPTMRRHAQELEDAVLRAHVDLYVNEETRVLGPAGRRSLLELSRRAREAGAVPGDAAPLQVLGEEGFQPPRTGHPPMV